MSGFSNTQYTNTISNLIQASESKIANPYYKFSDKKPTPVNYYKQNKTKSTLDCASEINYAYVSSQSALRYNKILNFHLYGLPRIEINYDVGDNGLEADPITGDAIILPNTIEPAAGDYFSIKQVKEDLLFMVDHVTPDTLDTGANIYKIEYHLELTNSIDEIEKQVVDTFTFIAEYVGTEYNCLISSANTELAEGLFSVCEQLTTYFNSLFFKSRVQTYVYKYDDTYNFYDPFMIEFMRRNKIMSSNDKFNYVMHQTHTEITFPYEYSRTFFAALETKDIVLATSSNVATADLITDINSLFTSRLEDYYQVKYMDNMPYKTRFNIFDKELINGIKTNTLCKGKNSIYNIIINYMNGAENYLDLSIVDEIHKMDYTDNKTTFYLIPFYIFIIRNYISNNILSTKSTNL